MCFICSQENGFETDISKILQLNQTSRLEVSEDLNLNYSSPTIKQIFDLVYPEYATTVSEIYATPTGASFSYYIHDERSYEYLAEDGGFEGYYLTYELLDSEIEFVEETFNYLDSYIDLDFTRTYNASEATLKLYGVHDLSLFRNSGSLDIGGFATFTSILKNGYVDIAINLDWSDPVEIKNIVRHEIGHALGMTHPGGIGANPSYTGVDTVMSYNRPYNTNFSALDIDILKLIWGEEKTTETNNKNPSNLTLSHKNFKENIPAYSIIGKLSTSDGDAHDKHTYSFENGIGDTDNNLFGINDDWLKIINSPDYESKSSYNIRIKTTDNKGSSFSKSFLLNVEDINENEKILKIGTYSIEEDDNSDGFYSASSQIAYFGRGGDDIFYSFANEYKNDGYSSWYLPSILVGGSGADSYDVGLDDHSIIFDADTGTSDIVNIWGYASNINNFITIDNRHLYITIKDLGYDMSERYTSVLLIDGMNSSGSIETIKFLDTSFSGSPDSINFLVNSYSQGNFSLEDAIEQGILNPRIIGVNNAAEARTIIKDIYENASRNGSEGLYKSYSGNSYDYKIKQTLDSKYFISNDLSKDEITGYSFIRFNDKDLYIYDDIKRTFDQIVDKDDVTGRMFRLYNAAFRRLPDPDGLQYWISKNKSGENSNRVVAQSFLASEEFIKRYGSNVSDETYTTTLYNNILGRDPDISGYNYWVGNLTNGSETRYELLLGFAESAENKALFTDMTGLG